MIAFLLAHGATIIATLVFALAWWRGGPGERRAALVLAAAWYASLLLPLALPQPAGLLVMRHPYLIVGVDGAVAAALLVLALRYTSLWLGAGVVLQGLALFLHARFLGGNGSGAHDYVGRINLIGDALVILLLAGVVGGWLSRSRRAAQARRAAAPSAQPLPGLPA